MIKRLLFLFFFVTTGLLSGQIIFAQIKDIQITDDNIFSSRHAPEDDEFSRTSRDENSPRQLATVTVIFENGETEFYENVENEFIESLENVLNVLPDTPEESTIPVTIIQEEVAENNESNLNETELTENMISELANNNNEGLAEETVLVNEHEIQIPGSEELGEVSQGDEIIFGEEGNISTEEAGNILNPGESEISENSETISTSEELSNLVESETEIFSEETEVVLNEEQSPEIIIAGENSESSGEISLPEEIIFSETEIPSEVGLPNNEEFGENLETGSKETLVILNEGNEGSLSELEILNEGELENLAGEEASISEGFNEEVTELEGIIAIGEGESTEFTEGNGEITELEESGELTELEGIVIIGEGEGTEFTEENGEITELEGIVIIGESEGEIPEFTEENGELTELEGIVIIGEGEIPGFTEENGEVTELEGIVIIGEGENTAFTEENGEITELEGIIIVGEEGEITEITELEGIPELIEEITELEEGIIIIGEEGETSSELEESELIMIELPEESIEVIIIGSGSGEETTLETGEIIFIGEVGEEAIVIIETGEGETIITEAEIIFGEGGETIIIIIPTEETTPEESPTEITIITGSGEFEVPNEQTTPPIPVETIIEVSETIIWSEATTIISETTIIETTVTEYVIIILETGFGSGSESIEEVSIVIVEEGEGGGSEAGEEQTYETVPINYESPVDLNFSVGTQVVSIQGGGGGNIDIDLGQTSSEESLEEEESNNQNTTSGSGSATWPGWPGWTGGPGWSSEPVLDQLGESGELTNWDIQVNTQARSVIQLAPGAQELQTASIYSGDFTEVISQVAVEIDDQLFFIDSLYLIRPNLNNIGLAPIIVEAAPKRCQQIESCETITMPGVGPQNRCKNHLICE